MPNYTIQDSGIRGAYRPEDRQTIERQIFCGGCGLEIPVVDALDYSLIRFTGDQWEWLANASGRRDLNEFDDARLCELAAKYAFCVVMKLDPLRCMSGVDGDLDGGHDIRIGGVGVQVKGARSREGGLCLSWKDQVKCEFAALVVVGEQKARVVGYVPSDEFSNRPTEQIAQSELYPIEWLRYEITRGRTWRANWQAHVAHPCQIGVKANARTP